MGERQLIHFAIVFFTIKISFGRGRRIKDCALGPANTFLNMTLVNNDVPKVLGSWLAKALPVFVDDVLKCDFTAPRLI
jgi:hypothetical protein